MKRTSKCVPPPTETMADNKNEATPLRPEWETVHFEWDNDNLYFCYDGEILAGNIAREYDDEYERIYWYFATAPEYALRTEQIIEIGQFMQQLNEKQAAIHIEGGKNGRA